MFIKGVCVRAEYTIRQVVDLTGLSEYTLRGWELRYHLFSPKRTGTGRRLYTEKDLRLAKVLKDLTCQGHKISDLADKDFEDLQNMIGSGEQLNTEIQTASKSTIKILHMVNQFDWQGVTHSLSQCRLKSTGLNFIFDLVLPLLWQVNKQIESGAFSISQEHILSALLRSEILLLKKNKKQIKTKVRLVMATPEGDYHELGLLIASVIASYYGLEILYLGCNLPSRDFCEASLQFGATHVLLVATYQKNASLLKYAHFIDKNLNKKIHFWLAGPGFVKLQIEPQRNCILFYNFNQFADSILAISKSHAVD